MALHTTLESVTQENHCNTHGRDDQGESQREDTDKNQTERDAMKADGSEQQYER